MNRTLLPLTLTITLLSPLASFADVLEGRCFMTKDANGNNVIPLDGKVVDGHTLRCNKGTWTALGSGTDTGDSNKYVVLYAWEGKSPDAKVELKFRPRTSECLVNVRASSGILKNFAGSGHECKTDYKSAMTMGSTKVTKDPTTGATTTSFGAQVTTSLRAHNFVAVYGTGEELSKLLPGDKNLYLLGAFIEDK
jgi:hypothetical protein